MRVNLQKIVPSFLCNEEIENLNYFNQFNVYETVEHNINQYKNMCNYDNKSSICSIEYTCPNLNIISIKIVNTMKGISLESQHLTGKKLVIVGEIELSLVITYYTVYRSCESIVKKVKMPFSTFIIIPSHLCNIDTIDIKYLIEDVSVVELCMDKVLVSITLLMQYIDK